MTAAARTCDRCDTPARYQATIHTRAELGDIVTLYCRKHYLDDYLRLAVLVTGLVATVVEFV